MTVPASSAQAIEWMVSNSNIGASEPQIDWTLETTGKTLLTEINKIRIEIVCNTSELVGLRLKSGGTSTNGKAKFTECKVYKNLIPGLEELPCSIKTPSQPAETIVSEEFKLQLELHKSGRPITLILPNNGEQKLALLELSGAECVLPADVKLFGTMVVEDSEGKAETERERHLVIEDWVASGVFVISETLEHFVKIDGSANVFLTGGSSGLNWSGLPG
jgi:hypothetical protein